MESVTKIYKTKKESQQEKYAKIDEIIEELKGQDGCLIRILHDAQKIFGYLSQELQRHIAKKLNKPLSEVYGVITFYSFLSAKPKGEYIIRVCTGTACYMQGGRKIIDRLKDLLSIEAGNTTADGKFTLEVSRCPGSCAFAPSMTINGRVYRQVNPDRLDDILSDYC